MPPGVDCDPRPFDAECSLRRVELARLYQRVAPAEADRHAPERLGPQRDPPLEVREPARSQPLEVRLVDLAGREDAE